MCNVTISQEVYVKLMLWCKICYTREVGYVRGSASEATCQTLVSSQLHIPRNVLIMSTFYLLVLRVIIFIQDLWCAINCRPDPSIVLDTEWMTLILVIRRISGKSETVTWSGASTVWSSPMVLCAQSVTLLTLSTVSMLSWRNLEKPFIPPITNFFCSLELRIACLTSTWSPTAAPNMYTILTVPYEYQFDLS